MLHVNYIIGGWVAILMVLIFDNPLSAFIGVTFGGIAGYLIDKRWPLT